MRTHSIPPALLTGYTHTHANGYAPTHSRTHAHTHTQVAALWHIALGQYGTDVALTVDGEKLELDNAMVVHIQNNQVCVGETISLHVLPLALWLSFCPSVCVRVRVVCVYMHECMLYVCCVGHICSVEAVRRGCCADGGRVEA